MPAVQQLFALRAEPGRQEEVIEILRADRVWQESHGITRAWASMILHGGMGSTGMIAYFLDSEDIQSMGKALDAVREARISGSAPPFGRAVFATGAPFALEGATMRYEITPSEPGVPEPEPPRTGFTVSIRPNSGPRDALMQALGDHQRFIEGLGGHIRMYMGTGAGPTTGEIQMTTYAPTWEALGHIGDRQIAEGPTPLMAAIQSDSPPAAITGSATTSGIDIS